MGASPTRPRLCSAYRHEQKEPSDSQQFAMEKSRWQNRAYQLNRQRLRASNHAHQPSYHRGPNNLLSPSKLHLENHTSRHPKHRPNPARSSRHNIPPPRPPAAVSSSRLAPQPLDAAHLDAREGLDAPADTIIGRRPHGVGSLYIAQDIYTYRAYFAAVHHTRGG